MFKMHEEISLSSAAGCSSGQPSLQAVLDSPAVQRSRSFGFAETVSKHFAVRVARLQDGVSRE